MEDILKTMAGVFLGEFLWAIVLFIFLYILIRRTIRGFKNRILETGFHISFGGRGFLKGVNPEANISAKQAKKFVRYSGDVVNSTINRLRN